MMNDNYQSIYAFFRGFTFATQNWSHGTIYLDHERYPVQIKLLYWLFSISYLLGIHFSVDGLYYEGAQRRPNQIDPMEKRIEAHGGQLIPRASSPVHNAQPLEDLGEDVTVICFF